jgi:hypothetical protein
MANGERPVQQPTRVVAGVVADLQLPRAGEALALERGEVALGTVCARERRRTGGDRGHGLDVELGVGVVVARAADVGEQLDAGAVAGYGRASGPPDAPICPIIPWTRAFGPSPIRVQESRARPRTARSTVIWEIPAY